MLHLGCRPSEAAYIVVHKRIEKNKHQIKHARHDFMATAPKSITKTKRDYEWLVPLELNCYVRDLLSHPRTGFRSWDDLKSALANYWERRVLAQAGVPRHPDTYGCYSLKTVRALRATIWLKLVEEYRVMKWEPAPPNPLAHTDIKTTKERYAEKGADNIYDARLRCVEKYGKIPRLRQPWMDEYAGQERKEGSE